MIWHLAGAAASLAISALGWWSSTKTADENDWLPVCFGTMGSFAAIGFAISAFTL